MKKVSQLILYLLLGLIIIGGFLLLIFSNELIANLQQQDGLSVVIPPPVKNIPPSSTINSKILASPRLTALVNNAPNFNFNNICWHPNVILSQPITIISTTSTTTTTSFGEVANSTNCVQGNALPFVIKLEK